MKAEVAQCALHWACAAMAGFAGRRRLDAQRVMRATAAAAIVFVVAGGGWGVYSRVQPVAQPKVIAMPAPINAAGGFKSAGAMRTPQTLQGPVLARPVVEMPKAKDGAANSHALPSRALPSRALPSRKPHRRRKTAGTSQSSGTSN